MIHWPSEKNKTSERGYKTKIILSHKGCIRRSLLLVVCLQREYSYFFHFVCGSYALKPLSLEVKACECVPGSLCLTALRHFHQKSSAGVTYCYSTITNFVLNTSAIQ